MRDINRIKPLLNDLETLWINCPDMRLCQLIQFITHHVDSYYIEDDELHNKIINIINLRRINHNNRNIDHEG